MEESTTGAALVKTSALEAAAAATTETAGDAARHVLTALQHYADDPDLTAALADLEQLAPQAVADATEQHNAGGDAVQPPPNGSPVPTDSAPAGDGGLAEAAASAPGEDPPAPEPPPTPAAVEVPAHGPDVGGWPNDWPEYRLTTRVRAKQMPEAFLTADGQAGDAGDYYIVYLDEHGEPRATSPYAVMVASSFATVYETA